DQPDASSTATGMMRLVTHGLSEKALKRGSFYNVDDLVGAIQEYINQHNEAPKPFVWTASATDILAKVSRARTVLNKA
ncbi:MAG: IS630 family transposase, partial [Phycisphaeraceae bacterium]